MDGPVTKEQVAISPNEYSCPSGVDPHVETSVLDPEHRFFALIYAEDQQIKPNCERSEIKARYFIGDFLSHSGPSRPSELPESEDENSRKLCPHVLGS